MEKIRRIRHEYDTVKMTVKAWGHTFAYWRYDVSGIPDEVKLYCLKGFADDLQDCTTSLKKSDYPRTEKGVAAYEADCLERRRALERAINEGNRIRTRAETPAKQELATARSLIQLLARKVAGKKLTPEEDRWLEEMVTRYSPVTK